MICLKAVNIFDLSDLNGLWLIDPLCRIKGVVFDLGKVTMYRVLFSSLYIHLFLCFTSTKI